MKYVSTKLLLLLIFPFFLLVFFTVQIISNGLPMNAYGEDIEEVKLQYSIEETTELMKSKKIGNIKLDHDDHVYKCMKISKEGKDLEGSVDALINFKTAFGDTLDDEEVNLIIEISKLNTELYADIALVSRKIGKKKTTVDENFILVNAIKKGTGLALLRGLERAVECKYKIENDYFSDERVDLLVRIGYIENEDRFFEIYDAMKRVGMSGKLNTRGLEVIYKLYLLKGDVASKIEDYLRVNKWKSRKQPGQREYEVIRDLMRANYAAYNEKYRPYKSASVSETKVVRKNKPRKAVKRYKPRKVVKKPASDKNIRKKAVKKISSNTQRFKKKVQKSNSPCTPCAYNY